MHARGAGLPIAARLGIDPALVTCDVENAASRLVIEHAGGRLDEPYGERCASGCRPGDVRRSAATQASADIVSTMDATISSGVRPLVSTV